MTKYEKLLGNAQADNINVIENYAFKSKRLKGLYCDGSIALSKDMKTDVEKTCVLAEELGHHYTTVGDIIDQSFSANRKQEMRGRILAYNSLVGLIGIIDAYKQHCQGLSETAEFLGVTEEFLTDSITYYKRKYGLYTLVDNYAIIFEPSIAVLNVK